MGWVWCASPGRAGWDLGWAGLVVVVVWVDSGCDVAGGFASLFVLRMD